MADLEAHAARIAELMEQIEAAPATPARAELFELLEHVDHLHRTCVWRLFELLTELGGKGLVERLTADGAVKTLFVLYDLIPSEPLNPVAADAPVQAPGEAGFVPLGNLRRRSQWQVAFAASDLQAGTLRAIEVDGTPVLICARADGVSAFRNACPGSVLPLHLSGVFDQEINCPWHGCRYDAATGARLDREGGGLEPFAVELREDRIYISLQNAAGAPGREWSPQAGAASELP